jgi:hypothetical protein
MFPARSSATIPVELPVRIQIVGFKIAIDAFAARTRRTPPRSRLHNDEWGFFLLGNLRRRQPRFLQRGILAEQRFLQRPSHTISLRSVRLLGPLAQLTIAAIPPRAAPVTFNSSFRRKLAVLQRYSITRIQGYASNVCTPLAADAREPATTP